MKVSFEGIGEVVMTFANNETAPAAAGDCVAMAANGEVKAAASGAVFCGVCVGADSGFAAVVFISMKGSPLKASPIPGMPPAASPR